MRRKKVRPLFYMGLLLNLMLVIVSGSIDVGVAQAQEEPQRYFFQTGHFIKGPFLDYFESIPHASFVLGYPITEPFYDLLSGNTVQYFQRARLEYNQNAPEEGVFRTPIGQILFERWMPETKAVAELDCRRDPHWPHPVCFKLLELFELYGGEVSLGTPVSGLVVGKNGRMMQYFTYGRIEWHTDRYNGPVVTLGDIGRIYFTEIVLEDAIYLLPPPTSTSINQITKLEVFVFTKNATVQPGGLQSVYVMVYDQRLLPIANAQVAIEVLSPNGQQDPYLVTTDIDGVAEVQFKVESKDIGLVEIQVTTTFNFLEADISLTSFRIWY